LTARTFDVDEAELVGLVQRRAENALVGALELATELTTLAPLSVNGHKRALNLVAEGQTLLPKMRDEIRDLEQAAFSSSDLEEGLAAFAEKRPPRFAGR
jgi:enoyl-CoA hydratase/carnithine racemase